MTTDKQSDHFRHYKNPEVISKTGGNLRVIAQLKNDKWAVWEAESLWGGVISKGHRLRDSSGKLVSFDSKQDAIDFSNKRR